MNTTLRNRTTLVLAVMGVTACATYEKEVATSEPQAAQAAPEQYYEVAESADEAEFAPPPAEAAAQAEPMPAAPARLDSETRGEAAKARPSRDRRLQVAALEDGLDSDAFAQGQAVATGADTEGYTDYGVNQATSSEKDRFSTFSIDVDTGSYTIARKKLNDGVIPPAASVRVEEFLNYFQYNYPTPDAGAFSVHLEAAPSPFTTEANTYLMRVGVQGKRISKHERKPVHLTFLVDVSGSMSQPDKLPLAQKALKTLTRNLREGDTVALATYAGRTEKILGPTGMKDRGEILDAIDKLSSGGGTSMSNGMELAYQMALQDFKRDHVNRVIVLSDGDANIGPMSHQDILAQIRNYVEEGVTLSTIGLGMGNYKDSMMEQLANKGNGNYYYIDDMKEATRIFESQMDGTLQVIAKDVKIQVEFDPAKVPTYRLIGYENRDIADKDFRDDKVDAGEIGAGHTVTALYEVTLNPKAKGELATVRIRAKKPDGYKAAEQEFHFRDSDVHARVADASKDFQFATGVAMFAEILRESPYAKGLSLELVEEVARAATSRNQTDRREFLQLLKQVKNLRRG